MLKRTILLNPGPVTTTSTVKNALVVSDICHREKEFSDLLHEVCTDIVSIVTQSEQWKAIPFTSSGTATVEACLSSLNYNNKRLVIVNNGVYGKRMVEIAQAYKLPYIEFCSPHNQAIDIASLKQFLAQQSEIGFLAFVHHETSTGMLNDLSQLSALAKEHHLITIVDAISSYAGVPIDLDRTPVDFLCVSINKCLQAFPGLAFVLVKEHHLHKERFTARNYYLDLFAQAESLDTKGQMRFTAPIQIVYALKQALTEFFNEGAEQHFERLQDNFQILVTGLQQLGFEFLLEEQCRSPLLIAVLDPQTSAFNFDKMHDLLLKDNYIIYPGQTQMTPTFRLAVMGDLDAKDIRGFLESFAQILRRAG